MIVWIIVVFGTFSVCMLPTYSEDIPRQVNRIRPYIESLRGSGRPVYLIMGVNNGEEDLERFDASYLFLDKDQKRKNDPRSIELDFNNLEQLRLLSSELNNVFDRIMVDCYVSHFTIWDKDHLQQIKNMLKPGGEFIFLPQYQKRFCYGGEPSPYPQSKDLLNEADIKIAEAKPMGSLIRPKTSVSWEWHGEPADREEIEFVQRYPQYMSSLSKEYPPKAGEWARKSHTYLFTIEIIFYTKYVPYYVSVLEEVFGPGNVKRADEPLPFRINQNWIPKVEYLSRITAIKR